MPGLSAFLHVLLDKLDSPELKYLFKILRSDFGLLQKLVFLDAVLDDVEEKEFANNEVKPCLNDLEDVFYEAEELLDEIAIKALRCQLEAKPLTKKVREMKLLYSLNRPYNTIKSKIKEINHRIQTFVNRIEPYRSTETSLIPSTRKPIEELPTRFDVIESEVYGRDADKEAIIKLLLSEDETGNEIGVIPIVGVPGIGKTTLARFVCDDAVVKNHFDLRVWVCVLVDFAVLEVTKSIVEEISWQPRDIKDLNTLQSRLKDSLQGKKFLLVLDDVRSENPNDWDTLRSPLIVGANGSKIVVTTRSRRVASIVCTVPSYNLKELSNENCWGLFASRAFGSQERRSNPKLEAIGREIMKLCEGLPLAAKAIGALLRLKPEVEAWDAILKSLSDRSSDIRHILPVLKLSYLHLPSHLKRCFAYCFIFSRGYEFEKEKLVLLWMAEGLLQQSNNSKRPEEVGDAYFNDLLFRSFFQQSSGDKSRFTMHDLIHDLAIIVSGEYFFSYSVCPKISARARRCSFITGKFEASEIVNAISDATFLKTFLPLQTPVAFKISNKQLKDLLSRLQRLRVLCLSHFFITKLPDLIGSLKHLRYLNLSHTAIKTLSNSVTALFYLQTLLLSNCHFLTELPRDFVKLINLRHLDIGGTHLKEMPPEMRRLQNLQTLTNFIVGKYDGSRIIELGDLLCLCGTLCISELQNVVSPGEASAANLRNKSNLDELVLQWSDSTVDLKNSTDVLDQLQPHTNLEKLSIEFYGGTRFPNWLGDSSFSRMVFVRLSNCKYCSGLPPLGRLPSLRDLVIEGIQAVQTVGSEFYGLTLSSSEPFQSLKTLKFEGMLGWKEWIFPEVESGGFPCLEELYILKCPMLKIDIRKSLPQTVKVEIDECPELVAAPPGSEVIDDLQSHDSVNTEIRIDDEPASQYSEPTTKIPTMPYYFPTESSSLMSPINMTEFPNVNSETDVPINIRYTQDSSKDVFSLESLKVSEHSGLMGLPPGLQSLKIEDISRSDGLATQGHSEDISASDGLTTQGHSEDISPDGLATPGHSEDISASESLKVSDGLATQGYSEDISPSDGLATQGHSEDISASDGLTTQGHSEDISPSDGLAKQGHSEDISPSDGLANQCHSEDISTLESLKVSDGLVTQGYSEDISASESLKVSEISQLMDLPPGLHSLKIEGFDALKYLPLMDSNTNLQHLHIINCCSLESFNGGQPPTTLKTLYIHNCRKLKFISPATKMCHLEHLCIENICDNDITLDSFPKLRSLSVWDCANFSSISVPAEGPSEGFGSLDALEIRDCPKLVSFPVGGLPTPNLTSIFLSNCLNLTALPEHLHKLMSLQSLIINECPELMSFPVNGLPTKLILLCITSCNKLTNQNNWQLENLTCLSSFEIEGGCRDVVSFPREKLLPINLNSLRISKLLDLKFLNYKVLQQLTRLKTLEINCCNKLQSLPEEGLPSSISSLCINECSLLRSRLKHKKGKDWYKIAHIPHIQINEEVIS